MVGTHLDITERKQAEQALREARAAAGAANQAKSAFLAKVSHELRTPLHGILGLAQLGARRAADHPLGRDFAHIEQAGRHLLGLVNDVLDLTRIESGSLQLERKPLDLHATLESALAMARAAAVDKGLDLYAELSPVLPRWVKGDAQRLAQVLMALLGNAVRFTERGRVGLTAEPAGDRVRIRIGDTGPGLAPDALGRVFEPFAQGDDSLRRPHGGAGLGLTIARQLTVLMDGVLTMDSRPGLGTLVSLDLPLPACAPPRNAARGPADQQRLAGLRVLAAEDNAINQLVLESTLADQGARLTLVDDGARAVELVKGEGRAAFDLVMMDIQMPVMDGYEATRQIRAFAPDLPILGLTANAGADERARCLAAGMNGHVAKPFEIDTLVAAALAAVVQTAPTPGDTPQPEETPNMDPMPTAPAHPRDEIDWQALEARFPGREDFVARLLEVFRNSNAEHPDALREAAARGDLGRVRFVAHSIKGSAANVQARVLADLAARTETAARDADPVGVILAGNLADRLQVLLRFLAERPAELEVHR
jgi:CheY-like chemotaxis protein/HPt (histidine-containing phosphotransfer) domain-containing protein